MQPPERIIENHGTQGNKKKEPSLEAARNALKALEHPEKEYKVILVGGSNGKGSTVEMVSELLQSQGLKVGVNKSPHLVSPTERIKLNSENISEEEFYRTYQKVSGLELDLSFFETITVMAYLYFSEKNVDYAVMEVGMGGKLDATNAADNEAAVITNVHLEHTEYLGESRADIAEEIAGIAPETGAVVDGSGMEEIEQKALERNSELKESEKVRKFNGKLLYRGELFELPIAGSFQRENLQLALTAVKELENVPESVENAVKNLECPGRMEIVSENPLTVLDGAHNPEALETAVEDLPEDFVCVFGLTGSKDIGKMANTVEQKASKVICTEPEIEWSINAETVEKSFSISSATEKNLQGAIESAKECAGEEGTVVITGSLYLVGDAKKILQDL